MKFVNFTLQMRLVRLHRFFFLDNDLEDQSECQIDVDLSFANTIIENDRIFYSLIKKWINYENKSSMY